MIPQNAMAGAGGQPARKSLTNIIPQKNDDALGHWIIVLSACYQKSVESIFELGRKLIECKKALKHGAWLQIFDELPFSPDHAEKIMRISKNRVLSNSANSRNLPFAIETLYILSKIDDSDLLQSLADRKIDPETTVREAKALFKNFDEGIPAERSNGTTPCAPTDMQCPIDEIRKITDAIEKITSTADLEKILNVAKARLVVLRCRP